MLSNQMIPMNGKLRYRKCGWLHYVINMSGSESRPLSMKPVLDFMISNFPKFWYIL